MSADAWRVCPKCLQSSEKKKESSYGKVSEEEYLRILVELDSLKDDDTRTMREDYEIFTDSDGVFYLKYSCNCSVCHFHFEYKYQKDLLNETD